jgi:hypothetical protein
MTVILVPEPSAVGRLPGLLSADRECGAAPIYWEACFLDW